MKINHNAWSLEEVQDLFSQRLYDIVGMLREEHMTYEEVKELIINDFIFYDDYKSNIKEDEKN